MVVTPLRAGLTNKQPHVLFGSRCGRRTVPPRPLLMYRDIGAQTHRGITVRPLGQ